MEHWRDYIWVGLGSAVGGMGRYWVTGLVVRRWGEEFPYGTLFANITGSLLIGVLAGLATGTERGLGAHSVRLFLLAGLLGGYTTFSAFSLQTLLLVREGHWASAGFNVLLSVTICLAAVGLGHWMGRSWHTA